MTVTSRSEARDPFAPFVLSFFPPPILHFQPPSPLFLLQFPSIRDLVHHVSDLGLLLVHRHLYHQHSRSALLSSHLQPRFHWHGNYPHFFLFHSFVSVQPLLEEDTRIPFAQLHIEGTRVKSRRT